MSESEVTFRTARREDVPAIVRLLTDDAISAARERGAEPPPSAYAAAFAAVEASPDNEIIVGEIAGAVVACLQLTYIPGLGRNGVLRAQIEAVRVASSIRGRGVGESLMRHAIARAAERGCGLVQLTSDRQRTEAQRFYERLGFRATHVGMKLVL
jgi:ribosomal protein S18 acetylase RimI-like enzyme